MIELMSLYKSELDAASLQRIDNVFCRGIKAWALMLLLHMKLKNDSNFKNAFSIQSLLAPTEEPGLAEEGSEVHLLPVPSASIPTRMLDTIPITIRDVLTYKR